uniref:Ribosomal protein S13 n=1 Tax=Storeatula sp. CCMP1868 TaxID=195070 RepID=A0A2P1G862_9CRYP|nr:ribosomal protein S13 [Storeatula sp. CCMP1868]AVM81151.1 ribosomal protein S13 [Storeatula sp. CCMP1868]
MVYIFGKLLNRKKKIYVALKMVYGLGLFQSNILCNKCQIGFDCKVKNLTQTQIINLCKVVDQNKLLVESHLRNIIESDIARLIVIKCFRSFFHRKLKYGNKK